MKFIILLSMMVSFAQAETAGYIKDFNYQVTDISSKGLSKEKMFDSMERNMLDLANSICANRAHLWGYDFLRFNRVDTGKIFIFFASSVWKDEKKGWMYHVAPYIVENGQEYVMEASYPEIKQPLTVDEWLESETDGRIKARECLEIDSSDTDLTEYFYDRYNLPEKRANGKQGAKCYFRKVPGYYWYPTSIAIHDLKKDTKGNKTEFNPTRFEKDDVLDACAEASAGRIGRIFGGSKGKCKKYLKM